MPKTKLSHKESIVQALQAKSPLGLDELRAKTKIKGTGLNAVISTMTSAGSIRRVGRGQYALPSSTKSAAIARRPESEPVHVIVEAPSSATTSTVPALTESGELPVEFVKRAFVKPVADGLSVRFEGTDATLMTWSDLVAVIDRERSLA
jgi:hypothetical protein